MSITISERFLDNIKKTIADKIYLAKTGLDDIES